MGSSYTPASLPPNRIVETYRGFNIIGPGTGLFKNYEIEDDPGSVPGSLEEYVYYDIGGGQISETSLSRIKEDIDNSIEDYEFGDRI